MMIQQVVMKTIVVLLFSWYATIMKFIHSHDITNWSQMHTTQVACKTSHEKLA